MAIFIKVETTGMNVETSEILQVCIVNDFGKCLFNEYVRPIRAKGWANAEKYHGITPDMVAIARTFEEVKSKIQAIFDNTKMVVGYNSEFEMRFLRKNGIKYSGCVKSAMSTFAPIYGDWNAEYGRFRYPKFECCAMYYGVLAPYDEFNNGLEKACALANCWKYLQHELKKEK